MLGLLALPFRGGMSSIAGGISNFLGRGIMATGRLFKGTYSIGSTAARSGNYNGSFGFSKARDFSAKTWHNVATSGVHRMRQMAMGQGVAGKVTTIAGLGLPAFARGTVRAGLKAGRNPWALAAIGAGALTFGTTVGAIQGYYGQPQWNPLLPGTYKGVDQGMSPDHLGTQGLTIALHKSRHR